VYVHSYVDRRQPSVPVVPIAMPVFQPTIPLEMPVVQPPKPAARKISKFKVGKIL